VKRIIFLCIFILFASKVYASNTFSSPFIKLDAKTFSCMVKHKNDLVLKDKIVPEDISCMVQFHDREKCLMRKITMKENLCRCLCTPIPGTFWLFIPGFVWIMTRKRN